MSNNTISIDVEGLDPTVRMHRGYEVKNEENYLDHSKRSPFLLDISTIAEFVSNIEWSNHGNFYGPVEYWEVTIAPVYNDYSLYMRITKPPPYKIYLFRVIIPLKEGGLFRLSVDRILEFSVRDILNIKDIIENFAENKIIEFLKLLKNNNEIKLISDQLK